MTCAHAFSLVSAYESWRAPRVKILMLVALLACERSEPARVSPAPSPTPIETDPVARARGEFELLPDDYGVGTHKLYSRGDFMDDDFSKAAMDEGDFLGRARALFGARDEFILRHKKTGYVVTIYSGNSGPSYGGGSVDDHVDRHAQIASDPILSKGMPRPSAEMSEVEAEAYRRQYHQYVRRMDDVLAGPELAAVVARLDALMNAVKPADWERTYYYEDEPSVAHVGVRGGTSFSEELEPAAAMTWLLAAAEKHASSQDDANALWYYKEHKDDLAAFRPRVQAALRRFEADAKRADPELRTLLLDEAKELSAALR